MCTLSSTTTRTPRVSTRRFASDRLAQPVRRTPRRGVERPQVASTLGYSSPLNRPRQSRRGQHNPGDSRLAPDTPALFLLPKAESREPAVRREHGHGQPRVDDRGEAIGDSFRIGVGRIREDDDGQVIADEPRVLAGKSLPRATVLLERLTTPLVEKPAEAVGIAPTAAELHRSQDLLPAFRLQDRMRPNTRSFSTSP